jgi:hypothetical protein
MNFSTAIDLFKNKRCMWRQSWGSSAYVGMQTPIATGMLTLPYFFRRGKDGTEPWFPTIEDMFATDWEIVTSNQKNAPEEAALETPAYTPTPTVAAMAAFNKARILRAKKAKEARASKTPRVIDPEAPWGRKKDGTPAKRRGPGPAVHTIGATPAP